MAALDLGVVAPLLPTMITDLGLNAVDADRYAWIVLSYLVAYTVTIPLAGRISDHAGRLATFAVALGLFAVGSIVAASAPDLAAMVVGRSLQGLGGGAMLPVSMALVADVVPEVRRAAALGLVAAVDTFGWVLGPVWGSAMEAAFGSWRAVFWLNLPLAAVVGGLLTKAAVGRRRTAQGSFPDPVGLGLGTVALLGLTLALSTGAEAGTAAGGSAPGGGGGGVAGAGRLGASANPLAAYRWPLLVVALVALVGFVVRERRSRAPLLPPGLIRQRPFQLAAMANVVVGGALIVAMVNGPLAVVLLTGADDSSGGTAVVLGSLTGAMTVGALVGGRLFNRVGARAVAVTGLVVGAGGLAAAASWGGSLDLGLMAATMAVAGLGLGLVIAPLAETALAAADLGSYGSAAGLVLVARLVGMTIGLAAATRYGLHRLDAGLAGLDPLPPQPGESTAAYFARQQAELDRQVIPLTLDVVKETFVLAAGLCLVGIALVRAPARPPALSGSGTRRAVSRAGGALRARLGATRGGSPGIFG